MLQFGWNNTRVCILVGTMYSKFPSSESACTIPNTVAVDVQNAIKEMEKKAHDQRTNLQKGVCAVRGKDEVNKVMAARAQVCLPPSDVLHVMQAQASFDPCDICRHCQSTNQSHCQLLRLLCVDAALLSTCTVPQ